MPTTRTDSIEFIGVAQITDRVNEGVYRANAATLVMGIFLLVSGFLLERVMHAVYLGDSILMQLTALLPVLGVIWLISFVLGYYGIAYETVGFIPNGSNAVNIAMPVRNVTADSDFSSQLNLRSPTKPGSFVYDQNHGRLVVSSSGISGIMIIPWSDFGQLTVIDEQTLSFRRVHREFGLPVGKRKVVLRFLNAADASGFRQYVDQRAG